MQRLRERRNGEREWQASVLKEGGEALHEEEREYKVGKREVKCEREGRSGRKLEGGMNNEKVLLR